MSILLSSTCFTNRFTLRFPNKYLVHYFHHTRPTVCYVPFPKMKTQTYDIIYVYSSLYKQSLGIFTSAVNGSEKVYKYAKIGKIVYISKDLYYVVSKIIGNYDTGEQLLIFCVHEWTDTNSKKPKYNTYEKVMTVNSFEQMCFNKHGSLTNPNIQIQNRIFRLMTVIHYYFQYHCDKVMNYCQS